MRPTFPLLVVALLLSPSHHPLPSFPLVQTPFFSSNHFSPSPTALYLHILPFFCLSVCLFPVCASCLPVVNPITIYYCLLPLARARTNAIVVGDGLAFCDKRRYMRVVCLSFLIKSVDLQMYGNRWIELQQKLSTILASVADSPCASCLSFPNEARVWTECSFPSNANNHLRYRVL